MVYIVRPHPKPRSWDDKEGKKRYHDPEVSGRSCGLSLGGQAAGAEGSSGVRAGGAKKRGWGERVADSIRRRRSLRPAPERRRYSVHSVRRRAIWENGARLLRACARGLPLGGRMPTAALRRVHGTLGFRGLTRDRYGWEPLEGFPSPPGEGAAVGPKARRHPRDDRSRAPVPTSLATERGRSVRSSTRRDPGLGASPAARAPSLAPGQFRWNQSWETEQPHISSSPMTRDECPLPLLAKDVPRRRSCDSVLRGSDDYYPDSAALACRDTDFGRLIGIGRLCARFFR